MAARVVPARDRLGLLGGEAAVAHGATGVRGGEGGGLAEVDGELGGVTVGVGLPPSFERVADLAVEPDSSGGGQLREEGLLHERVGEAVAAGPVHLFDDPGVEGFFDLAQQLVVARSPSRFKVS